MTKKQIEQLEATAIDGLQMISDFNTDDIDTGIDQADIQSIDNIVRTFSSVISW